MLYKAATPTHLSLNKRPDQAQLTTATTTEELAPYITPVGIDIRTQ